MTYRYNKIIKKTIIICLLLSIILNICIPIKCQAEIFDENITFSEEYVDYAGVIPYNLITPSTANASGNIPLILWLHGSGEVGKSKDEFLNAQHRSILCFKKF